ncbi:centrosomal protein kizuna [Biomphalaria glabrata]|nr:centrosomal protein kizuna-like [Biomphalaria glabrata]
MAASNVQFYENQKRLQDIITNCEQQRVNLDLQLKKVFQTDQNSVKLKAAKLHTYWKKVCEDEQKAKQRNEMILREFQRIDSHMAELEARTRRMAQVKKQYEDDISRKYPKWNDLVNGTCSNENGNTEGKAYGKMSNEQHQHLKENKQSPANVHKSTMHTSVNETTVNDSNSHNSDYMRSTHISEEIISKEKSLPATPSSKKDTAFHNLVANTSPKRAAYISEDVESDKWVKTPTPSSKKESLSDDHSSNYMSLKKESNNTISSHTSIKKVTQAAEELISHEPIKPIKQPQEQIEEPMKFEHKERKEPFKFTEHQDDSDVVSDFMSGSDLPMALSLGNTQISTQVTSPAVSNSSKKDSFIKSELTVSGLVYLINFIESDMKDAFSLEGYYRSSRPDTGHKNDIIRKANAEEDLIRVDANLVSMVVLEQISLIVRNLNQKCLLPKHLLQGDISNLTLNAIRENLTTETRKLWEVLFSHFSNLVKMVAIEPNELSAIFTPCLVPDESLQEKAHQFMCQLLGDVKSSTNQLAASNQFNSSLSPMPTLEGSNSFMEDGRVPPLKFGSLLDRPFSDDESTYINSSLPRDNIPLNETEAYKSLISTNQSMLVRQQSSTQDDTTDDDVEKQIASAMKKPVSKPSPQPKLAEHDDQSETSSQTLQTTSQLFSPRAITPRQNKPLYGSMPGRLGVKISSDLDTDTEVDALILGSSKKVEDDFDFYD